MSRSFRHADLSCMPKPLQMPGSESVMRQPCLICNSKPSKDTICFGQERCKCLSGCWYPAMKGISWVKHRFFKGMNVFSSTKKNAVNSRGEGCDISNAS